MNSFAPRHLANTAPPDPPFPGLSGQAEETGSEDCAGWRQHAHVKQNRKGDPIPEVWNRSSPAYFHSRKLGGEKHRKPRGVCLARLQVGADNTPSFITNVNPL